MQYFAQDEATRLDPTLTVYETLSSGSPRCDDPGDPQHPRRLPVLRRRRLQEGGGAVGRRAHAAGRRAHAAAAVEHAAARRADQPPRSRLEGSAARRARRLRRHARLRLARSLLRRAARDPDRRGRPTARRRCIRAPTPSSCGRRSTAQRAAGCDESAPRREGAGGRDEAAASVRHACRGDRRHLPKRRRQAGAERSSDRLAGYDDQKREAAERRKRERRCRSTYAIASPSSRPASPSASRRSRTLEAAMAAPGFYDSTSRPSRSSTGTRR